jgi:thiol-disulfide isomerase/thioredoxin
MTRGIRCLEFMEEGQAMKRLQTWAVLATLVVPGAWCESGEGGELGRPSSPGSMNAAATENAAAGVELVEFTARWCDQCREMDPLMEEVRARGYRVTQVDVDDQVDVAKHYGITQVPTILIVSRGKVVDRIKGATTAEALWPHVQNAAAGRPMPPASPMAATRSAGGAAAGSTPARSTAAALTRPAQQAPSQDFASLERRALEATVRLRVEDPNGQSFGSGTIVDVHGSEALILTCGHIFRDSEGEGRIHVELCGVGSASPVKGELIQCDLDRDVALVAIQTSTPVRAIRVAGPAHEVAKGQPLFSLGCNRGAEPTVMRGSLRSINQYLGPENLVVEGEPMDGRSGGGLFTYDGYLVGVCNAADPERKEGIYAAYPSIHKHLDKANLAFIYRGQDSTALATAPPPNMQGNRPRLDDVTGQRAAENSEREARPGTLPGIPGAPRGGTVPRSLSPPEMTMAAAGAPRAAGAALAAGQLPAESLAAGQLPAAAALDASIAQLQAQGAEVICIIRPRMDPNAKSQVVVLDRPSRGFLDQLLQERTDQGNRQMTQLRVPVERRLHPERVVAPPSALPVNGASPRGVSPRTLSSQPAALPLSIPKTPQDQDAWSRSAQEWEARLRSSANAAR